MEGYLDGQLSRRVFIRGLIATGVTAAAALSYAGILEAAPADAGGLADFYLVVLDFAFSPNPVTLAQGQGVEIGFWGDVLHTVSDTTGLNLFDVEPVTARAVGHIDPMPGAGVYKFQCDNHPSVMKGKFKVPVVVAPPVQPLGGSVEIQWAVGAAPAGLVFDVQRRAPDASAFSDWRTGVTYGSRNVTPRKRGFWTFRARVRRASTGAVSAWSRPATLTVT